MPGAGRSIEPGEVRAQADNPELDPAQLGFEPLSLPEG
jgi:hypothetical protein